MMIIRRKKSKSQFLHDLILYVVLIEIVVAGISIFLCVSFRSVLIKREENRTLAQTENMATELTHFGNVVKSLTMQVNYDYYTQQFCNSNQPDYTTYIPALQQLTNYRRSFDGVDSIYIYNNHTHTFYLSTDEQTNLIQTEAEFQDKGALELIRHFREYPSLKPIPRVIGSLANLAAGPSSNGYSMIFSTGVDSLDSMVIVNLNANWVDAAVGGTNTEAESFILDSGGRLVGGDAPGAFLQKDTQRYVGKILSSSPDNGFFLYNVNGKKNLVIYSRLRDYGWSIVTLIPYSSVISELYKSISNIILICFLIVLLGGAVFGAYTHRLIRPYTELANSLSNYQSQKKYIWGQQKQDFLKSVLLHGSMLDGNFVQSEFERFEIPFRPDLEYLMILIQIVGTEGPQTKDAMHHKKLRRYAIGNIGKELLLPGCKTESVDIDDDEVLFLINGTIDAAKRRREIRAQILKMQDALRAYFEVEICAYIGCPMRKYGDFRGEYETVLELKRQRFFHPAESVFWSGPEEERKGRYLYPEGSLKALICCLSLGKRQEALEKYRALISDIRLFPYSVFQIYISRILTDIRREVLKPADERTADAEPFLEKMILRSGSMKDLDELNACFEQLITMIAKDNQPKDKNIDTAERVRKYVESEFSNRELTVKLISDAIGMTPSYVTRIFKEVTGDTIIDYIGKYRLSKAKDYLARAGKSVAEISEKCGYSNDSYFYRIFKKATGMTPNEYRSLSAAGQSPGAPISGGPG